MVLGGLWHGANWTFVFWGFLHGAALCVHKLFLSLKCYNKEASAYVKTISVISTYVFVCVAWVFFRAGSFDTALTVFSRLLVWNSGVTQIYTWTIFAAVILVGATIAAIIRTQKTGAGEDIGIADGFYPIFNLRKFWPLFLVIFVAMLTFGLAYTGVSPFIYFRF
jgi:alginate O-acetyltransferase complex protein AlgI